MPLTKRGTLISASAATLVLIVGIAAFVWLRLMEIPLKIHTAVKQDKPFAEMADSSKLPPVPVVWKKIPPAPPEIVPIETGSPVTEAQPSVSESQTEGAKQELTPSAPETEPKPRETPEAVPGPAPQLTAKAPEKVEIPQPPQKEFPYALQVGAFRVKKNAEERILILEKINQKPYAFDVIDKKGTQWHTVRIGHYETAAEARNSLIKFKKTSQFKAVIIKKDSLSPLKKRKHAF